MPNGVDLATFGTASRLETSREASHNKFSTQFHRIIWPGRTSHAIVSGFAGTVWITYTPSPGLYSAKSPTTVRSLHPVSMQEASILLLRDPVFELVNKERNKT